MRWSTVTRAARTIGAQRAYHLAHADRAAAASTSLYPAGACHILRARLGCPDMQHVEPP